MTLRISLKAGEKMIVNGAVLCAQGRTELVVENQVALLRGREVMSPEEASTPARLLYFTTMLAYIDEAGRDGYRERIAEMLDEFVDALASEDALAGCTRFAAKVAAGDYYPALAECRALIAYEAEALARTAPRAA